MGSTPSPRELTEPSGVMFFEEGLDAPQVAVGFWGKLLMVLIRHFSRLDFYISTEICEESWKQKSTDDTFLVPGQEQVECIVLQ